MKDVSFEPWVGDNYKNTAIKIFVLGESAYFYETDNEKNINIEIIEGNALGSSGRVSVPFRRTASIISGKDYYENDYNVEVWNNVIFSNFIEGFIGEGHHTDKSYLSDEKIEASKKAFNELLKKHKPDLVIAWGISKLRAWMQMDADYEYIDKDNFLWKIDKYPNTLIWNIKHPSTHLSNEDIEYYKKYKNKILKLLKK